MAFIHPHIHSLGSTASLDSPTFTGDPKAPTPSPGDNDTSIATTAFVATSYAPINNASMTGSFEVNANQLDIVNGGGVGVNAPGSGGSSSGDTILQVTGRSGQTTPVIFSSTGFTNTPSFRFDFSNSKAGFSVPANVRIDFGNTSVNGQMLVITSAGRLGVWNTGPSAWLHLKAGDSAASGAPLKFTSGVNLATAEAGAMEYDGSVLYFTLSGTNRRRVGIDPTLNVNTTTVGNVGVGEDTLMTYSVPASTLAADNSFLRFRASGSIANSVNAKRLRVVFGTTTIFDSGSAGIPISAAIDWILTGEIIRKGATSQICNVMLNTNNATLPSYADTATASETLSGALTLKVTGEGVADNDLVQESFIVDYFRGI